MKRQVLLVDDEAEVLAGLRRTLRHQRHAWEMTFLDSGAAAWEWLLNSPCDAVVTDIRMPGVSGLELLERIQHTEQTRGLPVVMLTGMTDHGLKERALDLGAIDLLNKPVDAGPLVARIESVLRLKSQMDSLRTQNAILKETVQRQSTEVRRARLSSVCRLGQVAERRDERTGNHTIRVGCYSRAIGESLELPRDFLDKLLLAAPLHDIGKVAIPDYVLLKPGPLTPEEWAVMQRHCVYGEAILRGPSRGLSPLLARLEGNEDWFDESDPMLAMAGNIALTHHEKWDGTGYPLRLSGPEIPVESRIVAVSDAFDALTSERPYKPPYAIEEALVIVQQQAGSHFDPEVYDGFVKALPEIRSTRRQFADDVDLVEAAI